MSTIGTFPIAPLYAVDETRPDPSGARHRGQAPSSANRTTEGIEGRRHALILDQDPNVLAILGQLLGDEDYVVTISTRSLDAGDISRLAPDVIIVDAALDLDFDHDGDFRPPDASRRPDGTTIPVVYSTTDPDIAARLSGQRLSILLKPFDLDTLLALIRGDDT